MSLQQAHQVHYRKATTMQTLARIHYEIPDDLHREVKAKAALEGKTLKQYLIDTLSLSVGHTPNPEEQ